MHEPGFPGTPPKVPSGLQIAGRRLWKRACGLYQFRVDELAVLEGACRTADLIVSIESGLVGKPLTVAGSKGQDRVHPLIPELRAQRGLLAQMLRQLELPDEPGYAPSLSQRNVKPLCIAGTAQGMEGADGTDPPARRRGDPA